MGFALAAADTPGRLHADSTPHAPRRAYDDACRVACRAAVRVCERVPAQTGIPYPLLDGRFDGIPESYRIIGTLPGRRDEGEAKARYAEETGRGDPPQRCGAAKECG